jgi:hypothetical protein
MAKGTSVFRIRIELIFRRCWNLITPWGQSAQREIPRPRALMRHPGRSAFELGHRPKEVGTPHLCHKPTTGNDALPKSLKSRTIRGDGRRRSPHRRPNLIRAKQSFLSALTKRASPAIPAVPSLGVSSLDLGRLWERKRPLSARDSCSGNTKPARASPFEGICSGTGLREPATAREGRRRNARRPLCRRWPIVRRALRADR